MRAKAPPVFRGGVDHGMRVIRVGDWSKATRLLAYGPVAIQQMIPIAIRQEAEYLRRRIIENLKTQGATGKQPFVPMSSGTKLSRQFRNRPTGKSLIDTADLRNSITVHTQGDNAFVGIMRTAKGKRDGRPLASIAEIHEFGRTIAVPITRAMLRFLHTMFRREGAAEQSGSSQGLRVGQVLIIRIPPRPFIRPVIETFYSDQQAVRARFFGRLGRLLGNQFGQVT